jgi:hypothetical protein
MAGYVLTRMMSTEHVGKVRGDFALCDIISSLPPFQVSSSLIFKSVWLAWKVVVGLIRWNKEGRLGSRTRPIWSWRSQGTLLRQLPHLQACPLSKKGIFF